MTWLSIGSLSLPTLLKRENAALRGQIRDLSLAMAQGEVARPQAHLRGNTAALSAIDSRLSLLDRLLPSLDEAQTTASLMQGALGSLGQRTGALSATLLAADAASHPGALAPSVDAAQAAMADMLGTLSAQSAGRYVFSGREATTAPLPGAEAILSALETAVIGLTSAAAVRDAVEAALVSPGALFDTLYAGGDPVEGALIDQAQRHDSLPTAADPALRQMLAGVAMAALAESTALSLPFAERKALVMEGATRLLGVSTRIAELQGRVGATQETLERTEARHLAERDTLRLARLDKIGADPFETAARLTETQTQLETLYAVTARTARLSLTAYLR